MTAPGAIPLVATYRLQFRDGMTFDKAVGIVPYLQRLGVSHLYASPLMTATAGSAHGYDVTDCNAFDPALGGREGFERLHRALSGAGMGLILDIVPNHMAASLENAWWRSVVQWGEASPFARHFDIDWTRRLTLPILGEAFSEILAKGEIRLAADRKAGCLAFGYFDNLIPIHPLTHAMIAERLGGRSGLVAGMLPSLSEETPSALDGALAELSGDAAFLARLHDAQPWELVCWRDASDRLSYRRFFEIAGLVGLRVEDDSVFDDVHRLVLDLVRAGKVDGLRIDHVDGLSDPKAYLRRLRDAVGPDMPIFVEKILAEGEALRDDWPIEGTTGYEFIAAVSHLLADQNGLAGLERRYRDFVRSDTALDENIRDAKTLMLRRNFAGEFSALTDMAVDIAGQGNDVRQAVADAIREIVIALPVYRTYGDEAGLDGDDRAVLAGAVDRAVSAGRASPRWLGFIADTLCSVPADDGVSRFRRKFQQLTGPVMAKAVEDTVFYRHNVLIALNEVGGSPARVAEPRRRFHEALANMGSGLLATATHDTKRGEDARARLYAISEAPLVWADAVGRWREMNTGAGRTVDGERLPDPHLEWLFYQTLAGAWPMGVDIADDAALSAFAGRIDGWLEKAMREAKLRTDWLAVDEEYERAAKAFAADVLQPANRRFLRDFAQTLEPFARAGMYNSLAQTLAKLTAPGTPDIYQGSERLDFSLVDPDNRRAVDFSRLAAGLAEAGQTFDPPDAPDFGAAKQCMVARCLNVRRRHVPFFEEAEYRPLVVSGRGARHFAAFARMRGAEAMVTILPRLRYGLGDTVPEAWLELPAELERGTFTNVLTASRIKAGSRLSVDALLDGFPAGLAANFQS
ncbi:MAG: malto-oligosyltrehalose synthase [Rhizobiaceae bacterium]